MILGGAATPVKARRGGPAYHERMEPVLDALRDAAEDGLMPEGASVLLAVSGGADSMALLFGAAQTATAD